eukprot:s773_g4.t1
MFLAVLVLMPLRRDAHSVKLLWTIHLLPEVQSCYSFFWLLLVLAMQKKSCLIVPVDWASVKGNAGLGIFHSDLHGCFIKKAMYTPEGHLTEFHRLF